MSRRTEFLLDRLVGKCVLTGVIASLVCAVGHAGPIFIPGSMNKGDFKADNGAVASYTVKFSDVSVNVEDAGASLTIRETIVGPEKPVNAICLVPLPKGVSGGGAAISVNGRLAQRSFESVRYLDAEAAQQLYEAIAKQTGSVEIVALSGQPALLVPEVMLERRMEVVVSFTAPVRNSEGVSSIVCPMPSTEWSAEPVSRVTLTATVNSSKPLRAMFSPSHEATVVRNGLHDAVVRVKASDLISSDEFRLCWVADKSDLGLRVLAYRENDEEGGYFLLVGNPTGSDKGEQSIDKDIIFVLDTSGSMRGEKIEQCRAAIEYCLTQLNPGDRFNIVTFGTEVASFRQTPVPRSSKTSAAAQSFVESIIARGRTNIGGALAKSLAGEPQPGRPRIVIFLTDGTPTAGEQNADKILKNIPQWNTSNSRVFVVGVGDDVNAHLLDKLAESTNGTSEYITPEEEIDVKVATLYDRLSHPVLTNVKVDFGELATDSVYPKMLPALFKASEFMIFGRYRGGGRHSVSVSGLLNGVETKYTRTTDFPQDATDDSYEFVAPLWAARNIGFLLQEIRLHGENEELLKEVVRLSKKFGIVTEYTEFLGSIGGGALSTAAILNESRTRVARANQFRSGRWAVQQARNDRDLQTKMVVGNAANVYLDRRGKKVGRENVYQLGARCFYLNNGQWCDAEEIGNRKTRVVKLFSEDYFKLLREHPEFAKAQKLGWAMSVNVGDERVVIEKEGKQQSEELLERSQGQQQINQLPNQFDGRIQQQRGLNRFNVPQINKLQLQQQFRKQN